MTYRAVDAIARRPRSRRGRVPAGAFQRQRTRAADGRRRPRRRPARASRSPAPDCTSRRPRPTYWPGASRENIPAGLRELLWEPAQLYPDGVAGAVRIKGGPVSPGYEARAGDELAPRSARISPRGCVFRCATPLAEHERVWATGPGGGRRDRARCSPLRRGSDQRAGRRGHNLSLGHTAAAYHLQRAGSSPRTAIAAARNRFRRWRPVDAGRIHRTGQSGRADGTRDRRGRITRPRCGPAGRRRWSRTPTPRPKYADSPAALAAASDIVCLCVVGDDDVRGLAERRPGPAGGMAPGGIIVVHSTIHPDTCRELAEAGCGTGYFGDRRTGQRRRAGGRGQSSCW